MRLPKILRPPEPEQSKATEAGLPERRRARYVTLPQFAKWRNRALAAYVAVAVAAGFGIYYGTKAGRDGSANFQRSTVNASAVSCLSGADLRIVTAQGQDSLRRSAIRVFRVEGEQAARFLAETQPAIDRILSDAAGATILTDPPGRFTLAMEAVVRKNAMAKCARRAQSTFGDPAVPAPERTRQR